MAKKDLKVFLKDNKFTVASDVLDILEKQLDDEVYKLYGLTTEEIALVEESVK